MKNKKNILIVEDETAFLYAMQSKLSIKGFNVETATTGEEGLKLVNDQKFDLIILDLLLPKMDGYDLLRELKSNPGTEKIPVVIVSNMSDKENIDSGINLGAKDFIIKSEYNLDGVVNKIMELL
ncbi:response regulator [Patescibacteria group bacterium]|nr:response regulator [Patescibacteria group bacterium]